MVWKGDIQLYFISYKFDRGLKSTPTPRMLFMPLVQTILTRVLRRYHQNFEKSNEGPLPEGNMALSKKKQWYRLQHGDTCF